MIDDIARQAESEGIAESKQKQLYDNHTKKPNCISINAAARSNNVPDRLIKRTYRRQHNNRHIDLQKQAFNIRIQIAFTEFSWS